MKNIPITSKIHNKHWTFEDEKSICTVYLRIENNVSFWIVDNTSHVEDRHRYVNRMRMKIKYFNIFCSIASMILLCMHQWNTFLHIHIDMWDEYLLLGFVILDIDRKEKHVTTILLTLIYETRRVTSTNNNATKRCLNNESLWKINHVSVIVEDGRVRRRWRWRRWLMF